MSGSETNSPGSGKHDLDVVTFGEVMIRLATPGIMRLEQADSLTVHAGGGEMNVASALARLGLRAAFVTRLPENPLGRLAVGQMRFHGVDTSHILWTSDPKERMGLYFLEFGATPRPDSVLYDRADSAISRILPDMVDWEAVMATTGWFHVTGITPALSPSAAETTERAVAAARRAGTTVSLDLNYRFKLWSVEEARPVMERLAKQSDHIITTEEDADRLFGMGGSDFAAVAQGMRDRFGSQSVAVTIRQNLSSRNHTWTAVASDKEGIHEDRVYDLQIVDRVGGGDAFAAGYIYGLIKTNNTADGVRYGNGVSTLKASIPGDVCYCTASEVEVLIKGKAGIRIQR